MATAEIEYDDVTLCNGEQLNNYTDDDKQKLTNIKKIPRITPKQRRLADKDRFRTRTLSNNCDILSPSPDNVGEFDYDIKDMDDVNNITDINSASLTNATNVNDFVSTPPLESEGDSQSQEEGKFSYAVILYLSNYFNFKISTDYVVTQLGF